MEIEDVLALATVSSPRISPDGQWVAYVVSRMDFDENVTDSDVWVVSADGGEPLQLTRHVGRDNAPRWAPDSSWIAFLSSRDDDKVQVRGIRPGGGESWAVTEWTTGIASFRIAPDGAHLAFTARAEKSEEQEAFEEQRGRPTVWDEAYDDEWTHLWVAPLVDDRAGEAVRYSADGQFVSGFAWAPDSARLAYAARPATALRTSRHGSVFVSGGADASPRQVSDLPGGESPVDWTDAHGLLISGTGQALGTYNREIYRVDLDGGAPVSLTDALDENAGYVAATDGALLLETSHGTERGLSRLPLGGGAPRRLTGDERYYSSFSASDDGTSVAFLGESGTEAGDVYVVRGIDETAPRRLTDVNPQLHDLALGEQRVVRWTSRADGEDIEGVLNLPVGYQPGQPVPLLLVIHGGPSGVSTDRFSARRGAYPVQVFTGRGYAVLQPNYRGSTGYGERFRGLNRGDISGRDWIDIDSGVDAMIEAGIADPDRLGVMGWSFGGHHTYWGITQTDRYEAASAGAGANDLISMYSQTDIPEFYHTYLGPKPWEDFELYEQRSAYRFVENVVTPLLIQVGERDERVPAEQSIQFYEAVKSIGKAETQLVIYPGQPHGVREPRLVRDLLIRNLEWFARLIPTDVASTDGGY